MIKIESKAIKKTLRRYRLFSLLLLVFFTPLHASQASDKQQIIDAVLSMWKAGENSDLETYMQHIHPDYTLFGEGDAYLQAGKDKERIEMADYFKRAKGVRTHMHQPNVVIRGNTAWLTYYWSDAGYIGDKRFTSRGKSTRIFVKEKGRWLCIHSHFTEQG